MTNHPSSDDPAANDPSAAPDDESRSPEHVALEHVALEPAAEPLALEPGAFEPLALEPAAVERPADEPTDTAAQQPVTDSIPTAEAAAAAMSDDELLAAANASLHDEGPMANSVPGSAGSDPAPGPDAPHPGTGPGTSPGAESHTPGGQLPPTPPNPPGYGSAPPVRRVYRSRHDRKLGGVSAGIAEFFRIDPTVVRLATLVSAFTGIGILVYIAAWFIIPKRPDGYVEAPRSTPVADERTMTLAFGIAALALAFGIVTGSWAVLAIALIGGGVWLLSEHTAIAPGLAGTAPLSGTSNYQAPGAYEPGYAPAAPGMGGYVPPTAPAGFVPPVPPPQFVQPTPRERKPQHITWTVLSLLALLTAVGIAASTGDWWDVSITRLMGSGVVIIGLGIVAGQIRRGGARGLIPLGILTAIALFPVSAVDGLIDDGIGEANYRPTTIAELQTSYELGIGELIVDLSDLDFSGRTETIDIDLGIGELIVIVSDDTGGQAVLQATAGEVSHFVNGTNGTRYQEGVNVESNTVRLEGDNGTVELNINVGLGTAELRSASN